MEVDYKESKRTDRHGNEFRYRAKIDDTRGARARGVGHTTCFS